MKLKLPRGNYITADGRIFEAHKMIRLHRSWTLVLPKTWVSLFARDGWVVTAYSPEQGDLTIRAPSAEEMEVLRNHGNRDRQGGH